MQGRNTYTWKEVDQRGWHILLFTILINLQSLVNTDIELDDIRSISINIISMKFSFISKFGTFKNIMLLVLSFPAWTYDRIRPFSQIIYPIPQPLPVVYGP